eukprot:111671-Rhodomonas_salina.1
MSGTSLSYDATLSAYSSVYCAEHSTERADTASPSPYARPTIPGTDFAHGTASAKRSVFGGGLDLGGDFGGPEPDLGA